MGALCGRNEKDIFIKSAQQDQYSVLHFNGIDVVMLRGVPGVLTDIAVFPDDVFLLSSDGHPIVTHGRLK
jgi:hypothetical protein